MATITSAQSGNWSATSTWAGGVVPGDGDFVNISHAVVIDQDVGTVGGGGVKRIRVFGGSVSFDALANRTVLFASTGTDNLGTGTKANPGDDANMFGFYQSNGALSLVGTEEYTLTITSANDSSPVYIAHDYGFGDHSGAAAYSGSNITLRYCNIKHLGADGAWGLLGVMDWDGSGTFNVRNCFLDDVYYGAYLLGGTPIVTDNTFGSTRHSQYIYTPSVLSGADISRNTFLPGSASATGIVLLYAPLSGTFSGNVMYAAGGSCSLIDIMSNVSGTPLAITVNDNVLYNTSHGGMCVGYGSSAVGSEISGIVAFNTQVAVSCGNGGASVSNSFIRRSTTSEADHAPLLVSTGEHTLKDNVIVHDSMNGTTAIFSWRAQTGPTAPEVTVHCLHNTAINLGAKGSSKGFTFGNGDWPDDQCTLSSCKSNLAVGFANGFYDYPGPSDGSDPNDYVEGGVSHNATFDNTVAYYRNTGAAWDANNWDNGTDLHPNAIYGDIDGQNPNFVDTSRTIATYAETFGVTGTAAEKTAWVFNELGKRTGIGGATPAVTINGMRSYLRAGFAPTNIALKDAGHDGVTIGAVEWTTTDETAPILTLATATATGATTATGTVTTDEGNGTLYFLASENATESAATIKAALSQSVTATGAQSVSLSALDSRTHYYLHILHRDAAGNDSNIVVAEFTTQDVSIAMAFNDAAPAKLQAFLATSNLSMSDAELKALLDGV